MVRGMSVEGGSWCIVGEASRSRVDIWGGAEYSLPCKACLA